MKKNRGLLASIIMIAMLGLSAPVLAKDESIQQEFWDIFLSADLTCNRENSIEGCAEIRAKDTDKLKTFLAKHPKFDVNKERILLWVVLRGYTDLAKILIQDPRTDLNAADPTGMTALINAVDSRHPEISKALLNTRGRLDINHVQAGMHRTALTDIAYECSQSDIFKMIISYPGVDVNIHGINDVTALKASVEGGCIENVKSLINHPNLDRQNPLSQHLNYTYLNPSRETYAAYQDACRASFRFTDVYDDVAGCNADFVTFQQKILKHNATLDEIKKLLNFSQ